MKAVARISYLTLAALLPTATLLVTSNTIAQEQQAHVHGVAELLVVLDGEQLEIEFHTPAMNLLGFEHKAQTEEQLALVETTARTLADADKLFELKASGCTLKHHSADFGQLAAKSDQHHRDQGEPHAHHQNHEEHGKHEEHGEHEEHEHNHSDIETRYQFACTTPNKLTVLTTHIPEFFPGVKQLQVEWIVDGRQGAARLEKSQSNVVFK